MSGSGPGTGVGSGSVSVGEDSGAPPEIGGSDSSAASADASVSGVDPVGWAGVGRLGSIARTAAR